MKLERVIIKFTWQHKGPNISKTLLKKYKVGECVLCNPKYNKGILNAVWYSNKDKKDGLERISILETHPWILGKLSYKTGSMSNQWTLWKYVEAIG